MPDHASLQKEFCNLLSKNPLYGSDGDNLKPLKQSKMRQKSRPNRSKIVQIASCGLLVINLLAGCTTVKQQTTSGHNGLSQLAREMIGTWVHVGSPGRVVEPPEKGGRFKYRTGTHWCVIGTDADTGLVTEIFGGTYTMNGDQYVETQAFADTTWLHDNGKSWTFKAKIERDTMTQIGVGNPYTEVWRRVR